MKKQSEFDKYATSSIIKMRKNLYCNKKWSKKLFDSLFDKIKKRRKFFTDKHILRELYFLQCNFYKDINQKQLIKIGSPRIPVFLESKHNLLVPHFQFISKKSKELGPIFHFDTHDDMNDIEHPIGRKKYLKKPIEEQVWDIGSAVTGFVWKSKQDHDLFWFFPEWVNYPYLRSKYDLLKQYDLTGILIDKSFLSSKQRKSLANFFSLGLPKNPKNIVFSEISNIEKLRKVFQDINLAKFILDIDVDYFVTNGNHEMGKSKKYDALQETSSYYRTKIKSHSIPRDHTLYHDKFNRFLNKEIKEVNKRISKFGKFLRYLKKNGARPSAILISDSSISRFVQCDNNCNDSDNGYVPNYLLLLVRERIVKLLKNIYN